MPNSLKCCVAAALIVMLSPAGQLVRGDEPAPVFSGPQPGEPVAAFTMRVAVGPAAGKPLDPVTAADGKPLLLIFVHDLTRPSVGLSRLMMKYAAERADDGLHAALVFLSDDPTATENWMKRARGALPADAAVGISVDGAEGPGAYGLNRDVAMTVLVAKQGRVSDNFPLVQPSVQADGPKILAAIAAAVGGKPAPTLAELGVDRAMQRGTPPEGAMADDELRALLGPVIRKDAAEADIDAAAGKVDARMEQDAAAAKQIRSIAARIVAAGVLKNYGAPKAQEHIRRWAGQHDPQGPASPQD